MDNLLLIFFSTAFVFATLGISSLTFMVEYFLSQSWFPGDKASNVWKKLVLPILPIIVGAVCGWLFAGFPYPDEFKLSVSSRIVYCMVAGTWSSVCVRIIKDFLLAKLKQNGVAPEVVSKIEAIEAIKAIDAVDVTVPGMTETSDEKKKDSAPPQLS